jgi:hypothetical protein
MRRLRHRNLVALTTMGLLAATLAATATAGAQGDSEVPTCAGMEATVIGTDGDDDLVGTPGDDVIWAGPGDDSVRALDGDDVVCGGTGDDEMRGGAGSDALYGQRGADFAVGGPGEDLLDGGPGADRLLGAGGDDGLFGRRGVDTISGGRGADVNHGGGGWDDCDPGPGRDVRIRCEEKILAEANGPLGGAALETDPARAIRRMTRVFGEPTDDSGWVVGCPLDSETEANERLVQWGSLGAFFYGTPGNRTFISWDYRPLDGQPEQGGPRFTDIVLPGEFVIGDPLQSVADALGVAVEPGLFGDGLRAIAPGGGLEVTHSSDDPTGPIETLRVGDYLICD